MYNPTAISPPNEGKVEKLHPQLISLYIFFVFIRRRILFVSFFFFVFFFKGFVDWGGAGYFVRLMTYTASSLGA